MYFLGLKDDRIGSNTTSSRTNKIGGAPDWTAGAERCLPDLTCRLCGRQMSLVLQIYSPLDKGSFYHRTLYIFCCISSTCWNKNESWKIIRSQERDETVETTSVQTSVAGCGDWLEEQDDWGESLDFHLTAHEAGVQENFHNLTISSEEISKASSESILEDDSLQMETVEEVEAELPNMTSEANAEELRKQERERFCVLERISGAGMFESYYVAVVEEPASFDEATDTHVQKLLQKYELSEGSPLKKSTYGHTEELERHNYAEERYEKTGIGHGYETFYKFNKRLRRCPQQLVRFCWEGEPLLISRLQSPFNVSNCNRCKEERCFELQVMPALVHNLKLEGVELQGPPVEFGTVLVYCCRKSCWEKEDTWTEEVIVVQADPDESFWNKMMS